MRSDLGIRVGYITPVLIRRDPGRVGPVPACGRDVKRERGFVLLQKCNVLEYGNSTCNQITCRHTITCRHKSSAQKNQKKTVRSKLMQYVLYRQQQQQQQQQKQQQQQRQRSTATTAQLRAAYRAATQPRKVDILYFSPSLNTVRTGTFRRQTPGKRTCDVAIYPLVQTVDILPHLSLGVVDAVAVFPPRDPLGVGGLCRCVG